MEEASELAERFVDDELISIELDDGGSFKVQRATLCETSQYFTNALRGGFAESRSKELRIPGCTTDSFKLILYYLCYADLPDLISDLDIDEGEEEEDENTPSAPKASSLPTILINSWVTCDMLLMVHLQNFAMQKFRGILKVARISVAATSLAFATLPPESPIRRAILRQASRDFFRESRGYQSRQDLDAFGQIPGFLPDFLAATRLCPREHLGCRKEHMMLMSDLGKDKEFFVADPESSDEDD
ncbi:hypothetical protein TI39_contig412g00011 [Zymoseptoria brevis]|uniref:BTB domain-containing protein n=1 Tax=Zymoseptoria brevis TaxID=1047168 RepID=A0A0F4GMV9_9PEZI|nr:hypothetical protein TI39_contig412g00011 [Zymoseptoria brevis]